MHLNVETGSRGQTVITARAVSRLAAHTATEVDDVDSDVKAAASIDGDRVVLRVKLPLRYPAPVRQRAREARTRIRQQVMALTGLTVVGFDMKVTLTRQGKRAR